VVEADSESEEDIEEARKEAGLQLINLLLKGGE